MNNSELRKVLEKLIRVELASNIQGILLSSRGGGKQRSVNDNNLFFTLSASVLFYGASSATSSLIDNSILKELNSYKNKDGKATYNFWRTNPYEQFPTSFFLSRIKHFWVPDDLDCTALAYFFHSREEGLALQYELEKHHTNSEINYGDKLISFSGYGTWLGEKMPLEIDVCVISNYLYFHFSKSLERNSTEEGLIRFLWEVVKENLWFTHPFKVSPSYQKPHVIIWHISRCLKYEGLADSVEFISYLHDYSVNVESFEEKLFVDLTYDELGLESPLSEDYSLIEIEKFIDSFSFFSASLLTNSRYKILKRMAPISFFNIPFTCRGFNAALLLKRLG